MFWYVVTVCGWIYPYGNLRSFFGGVPKHQVVHHQDAMLAINVIEIDSFSVDAQAESSRLSGNGDQGG